MKDMKLIIKSNFIDSKEFITAMEGISTNTPSCIINEKYKNISIMDKPITIFNDYTPKDINELLENEYNILLVLEPNQLFGIHDWTIKNGDMFNCILTWGDSILKNCENSSFFTLGTSWLSNSQIVELSKRKKNFEVSFLCGAKRYIEGHFLRHKIYHKGTEIIIPKKWFYTLPDYSFNDGNHTVTNAAGKSVVWEDSMFSICVENSQNSGYHTEKIIDAFLTKTVPIYWGCTNLEELGYDPDGFIYIKDESDVINKVNALTEKDYYDRMYAINKNLEIAKYYANAFGRFRDVIEEIIEINNI